MSDMLSAEQIGAYASKAGFTGNDLRIAVAVALAESGGNPRAHNAVPPDDSYGLWQINMLGSMGPDRRRRFGITSNDALYDPMTNARAAHSIWQDSGWKAWTTYTSEDYKKHLSATNDPSFLDNVKKFALGIVGGATGNTGLMAVGAEGTTGIVADNPLTGVAQAVDNVGQNLFKGVASLVAVFVVGFLFVAGILILARNTAPVQAVKGYATRNVKRGLK